MQDSGRLAGRRASAILNQVPQSHIDFMLSRIPMGRLGTIEEIAAVVGWAASEDRGFTAGAVFDASGGQATD